jgi:hypothetical protein
VDLRSVGLDVVDEALGRTSRRDPVSSRTGGPAGNARLTAWTGVVLLTLLVAEFFTLIDVGRLISWHLAIGVLLIPPALLKTASTGWRIVGYYLRRRPYRLAGPPPTALRVLGPLVITTTVALLGSGLLLILVGPAESRTVLLDALGQRVDWVTVHQAVFVAWAVVTGLHVLARLIPTWRLTGSRAATPPVPGGYRRAATLAVTALVAILTVLLLWPTTAGWRDRPQQRRNGRVAAGFFRFERTGLIESVSHRTTGSAQVETLDGRIDEQFYCAPLHAWWSSSGA